LIESSSSKFESIITVLEGAATLKGCTTKVESSEKKELFSEVDDFWLAKFLKEIPKEIFE